MTVIATGLSSATRKQQITPPLSVVHHPVQHPVQQPMAQPLRTCTDNIPVLVNQLAAPTAAAPQAAHNYEALNTPSVWRHGRTQAAARVEALSSNGMDEIEIPAFLRKQAD